ncbi:MAG: polyprenyl synthetase family protein [Thermodesulfobacteriota bacterium]
MDIQKYLQEKKDIIDSALDKYLPREVGFPATLGQAIRYSLFAGGKRIRPILSIASYEAVGGKGDGILPFACAMEMIHTYSLIHDDLPAIDNDDYRRGKLTCHKVFGEAISILAGDALLTEAFKLMSQKPLMDRYPFEERLILEIIHEVAFASGIFGMVGGQAVDIESEGKEIDFPTLQYIHTHKTGALILASIRMGAKLGGAEGDRLEALSCYGEQIGLVFQIVDDILNVQGNVELLGKMTGSDLRRRKATYPSIFGVEESKRRAEELAESAVQSLNPFGTEADPLREIAWFIVKRES